MLLKRHHAFSLIELMIVITIIGILAAVAVPAYQNYVIRAKTTEAIVFLAKLKNDFSEYYQTHGSVPAADAIGGLPFTNPTPDIASVTWDGVMAFRLNFNGNISADLNGKQLVMVPTVSSSGVITWECRSSTGAGQKIPPEYLPASCPGSN